jgi:glycosyltransferase involved in cell wall biosynthesis
MAPTISIGLPVYNGEDFLDAAIESILAQDYEDFELIISDNASTDSTERIARHYVVLDSRVRYCRNRDNLGVEENFNLVFRLASGRYFKWAAYDDLMEPRFLASLVAVLDANPDVVLCQSLVRIIDANGHEIGIYDSDLKGANSIAPAERFSALIKSRHLCTELYGICRADALEKTRLLEPYFGSDRALLAELAAIGRFAQVREVLFASREHTERSSRRISSTARTMLPTGEYRIPTLALYRSYGRAVSDHVRDESSQRAARGALLRWWAIDWNFARLLVDVIAVACPTIVILVNRLKILFYGPLPQVRRRENFRRYYRTEQGSEPQPSPKR